MIRDLAEIWVPIRFDYLMNCLIETNCIKNKCELPYHKISHRTSYG